MLLATMLIIRNELNRIERETGTRPEDWMDEVASNAECDWTVDGIPDIVSIVDEISANADHYIEFCRVNYPELKEG